MCKKLLYFVAAILVVGLIGPAATQAVDVEIGYAVEAPVIDGEVDAMWLDASIQNMVPIDPADASGNWSVLYDSANLYVIVDITDDALVNDTDASWRDDSVEFYFDGGNTKLGPPLGDNRRQYTFGWATDEVQGSNTVLDGVEHAQVDTAAGWRLEMKLPWMSLQGAEPAAGDLIGIDCFYNDDDDGDSRDDQIFTFAIDGTGWSDSSQWGTAVLLAETPEPVDPGNDGLVAYYAFENDANDSSGNGLNGTLVGDPNFVEGLADYGMALNLDGIDDVVELGKFDVNGLITIAAWIKADDFEINDARVITKAQEWGGNDHWWMLSTISETSLRFRLKTDDGQDTATLISDPVLEAGVWAHVAAGWDGSTMRIYKDGVEVASQEKGGTAVAVDPNISVAIGSQPSDAFASDPGHVVKFFDGLIDEAQIYERALSDAEVLYLAGFRPPPVITAGPISELEAELDPDDPSKLVSVLKINGIDAADLIVGMTTTDFEKWSDHPAVDADNLSLTSYASLDDSTWIQTMFDVPVITIFMMERGANDSGFFQPIDADGNPIGEKLAFTKEDFQFQDTGLKIQNQNAGGIAIEAEVPINGLLILPPEGGLHSIDPASISAVPAP